MNVTVVTGGGSGIGRAICLAAAARGDHVVVSDRSEASVAETVEAITKASGKARGFVADVTRYEEIDALIATTASEIGRPNIVVASAGIVEMGLVTDMTVADARRSIEVNLLGTYALARSAMPHLSNGGGSFVAIASDAAVLGTQQFAIYTASKHGVLGLIKCLALDHARDGVRSNAVCPGYTRTPLLQLHLDAHPGLDKVIEDSIPLGHMAAADDIANMTMFVTSEAGRHVNGATLLVDGGACAGPFVA